MIDKSKFRRNYTKSGYLMKYHKANPKDLGFLKNVLYQFNVELPEILPSIWRRIWVPSNYNLWDLHVAIQDSMGWTDSHLHHFEFKTKGKKNRIRAGIPDFERLDEDSEAEIFPGWEIPIATYFDELGVEARYLYDYGDNWWHTVKLEGYMAREKGEKYPVCIDGAQACPPEDCGGEGGYHELISTLANPDHEEFEETKTWIGDWKPDRFSKDEIRFDDPHKRWKAAFLERESARGRKRSK